MEKNVLISVIVPIYNVENYVVKCVESIINQTYKNLEIILINDGSTDNSPQICENFAKQDDRVVVINKENGGLSSARNAGINFAHGEYLGFVDGDDYIHPKMFEELVERIIYDNTDIAICDYADVPENGIPRYDNHNISNEIVSSEEILHRLIHNGATFYTIFCIKLIKKSLFIDNKFKEGVLHEDAFLVHHIIGQAEKISCTDQRLYYYVRRKEGITEAKPSVRSLDVVEAFLDRTLYVYNKNMPNDAAKVLNYATYRLVKIYHKISPKDSNVKQRYKELKKAIRKMSRALLFKKCAVKYKCLFILFSIAPCGYKLVLKIMHRL